MNGRATVVIGGDLYPSGCAAAMLARGDARGVFGEVLDVFTQADIRLANLEAPLIKVRTPRLKSGPVLSAGVECAAGLRFLDAVVLANNHIMDHGQQGLRSTLEALERVGIGVVGAGQNIEFAGAVKLFEVNGIRVGFLAMAEDEGSLATEHSCGANPLDPVRFVRKVTEWKKQTDHLVVVVHGGAEHFPYPRPGLRELCRFFVEQGASCVVCQHTHCPGSMETYMGSPIIYGQGDLLFLRRNVTSGPMTQGFLLKLALERGSVQADIIPYTQVDRAQAVQLMVGAELDAFMSEFCLRNERLATPGALEVIWRQFCRGVEHKYVSHLCRHGPFLSRLNRRLGLSRVFLRPKFRVVMRNMVTCETNREILATVLHEMQSDEEEV